MSQPPSHMMMLCNMISVAIRKPVLPSRSTSNLSNECRLRQVVLQTGDFREHVGRVLLARARVDLHDFSSRNLHRVRCLSLEPSAEPRRWRARAAKTVRPPEVHTPMVGGGGATARRTASRSIVPSTADASSRTQTETAIHSTPQAASQPGRRDEASQRVVETMFCSSKHDQGGRIKHVHAQLCSQHPRIKLRPMVHRCCRPWPARRSMPRKAPATHFRCAHSPLVWPHQGATATLSGAVIGHNGCRRTTERV